MGRRVDLAGDLFKCLLDSPSGPFGQGREGDGPPSLVAKPATNTLHCLRCRDGDGLTRDETLVTTLGLLEPSLFRFRGSVQGSFVFKSSEELLRKISPLSR